MYKELTTDNGRQTTDDTKYLLSLLKKQAEDYDREDRALAAIVLQKAGEEKKAKALMPRLHELLRHGDGMYLAYPGGSFVSIDRKVETHVSLMVTFQIPYINNVIWYLSFSYRITSFSMITSSCTHVAANGVILFFLWLSSTALWRRQWHPTPVLLPGKSQGWGSLVGCSPWGR